MRRRPTQADQLKCWVRGFKLSLFKGGEAPPETFQHAPAEAENQICYLSGFFIPKISC